MKKRWLTYIGYFLLILIVLLFILRILLPIHLDDISPGIPCDPALIERSDVLFVIPNYNNISISEDKEWCNKIMSYEKELGLHGVYHTYQEFKTDKNQEYLDIGIESFEKCFNTKPLIFKPPQLKINSNNCKLIKSNKLKLHTGINSLFHKVYHCNDTGRLPNSFIRIF